MLRATITGASLVAMTSLFLAPPAARAQGSGIAGLVRDATGGVIPGVTVEAASPSLIEKVRTTVTDEVGRYNIVDLRPGTYTVTFMLPGFATLRREDVELTSGFTATVNAEMTVGAVGETVTVTGATPVVDTQSVRTQQVMKTEVLESLPSGMRDPAAFASLTLGATASTAGRNDVGGNQGENNTGLGMHGSRGDDGRLSYDGMNANNFYGGGGGQQRSWRFNMVAVQEVVVDTGGNSAEIETSGANMNLIPREGATGSRSTALSITRTSIFRLARSLTR
jgi:Carboxypeptidase regulatory-like domain